MSEKILVYFKENKKNIFLKAFSIFLYGLANLEFGQVFFDIPGKQRET